MSGLAIKELMMGACALQVGHQGAVTSTMTDLPADWAASKAACVNGAAGPADWATAAVAASIAAAVRNKRRVSMGISPKGFFA